MRKTVRKRNSFSLMLILAGILILAAVAVNEAFHYPWATIFGGSQSDSVLSDPPPIDWGSGGEEPFESADASSVPETSSAITVLPGSEVPEESKPVQYTELGIIKIPKLGLSQHILEGSKQQLHYGVGHVTGTARPGGSGNCALAGHNTTSFRYLNKLFSGDRVILKANGKVYTYSVFEIFTVLPTDIYVLNPVKDESAVLTLITCTPYLTGTHRLIVRARLTETDGRPVSSAPAAGFEADSNAVPAQRNSAPLSGKSSLKAESDRLPQ